jgi:ammonia channel protein AmtB
MQDVAVVHVHLLAGNWGAIIFGVVASSCGLLGVMAAGCYSDVSALLANSRQKQKQAAGSRRSSRANQQAMAVAVVQQMLGQGQQGAPGTAGLHQH